MNRKRAATYPVIVVTVVTVALWSLGCREPVPLQNPDATTPLDAALSDSRPALDSGLTDAATGVPLAGFGVISGDCGPLDGDDLDSPEPGLVHNTIDFASTPYHDGLLTELSAGAQKIYSDGNAGGSSIYSEMFAYEVLHRCELAALLKTENEIVYDTPGKITDFLAEIDTRKIGVSVTRAFRFPPDQPYTVELATTLLEDKLADILDSSANVSAKDAWRKQILHIMAYEPMHVQSLDTAYAGLDPALAADTLVVVTLTDGQDDFMY